MDSLSAGLTLLVGFGSFDGLTQEEETILISYVRRLKKVGYAEKDIINEWETIKKLDDRQFEDRFLMAIDYFKDNLSNDSNIVMIGCIMFMLISDAEDSLSETENKYFNLCCERWGVEVSTFLDSFESIMKNLSRKRK